MARRATYIARHGSHSRQRKRSIALAMLAVAGCVALGLLLEPDRILAAQAGRNDVSPTVVSPTVQIAPKTSAPVAGTVARRVYPYSIVPGGVSGRDELLRVIKTDKVVAAHYVSFDAEKAVKVTVTKPRAVYVSYRKGDKVYWTAKKLMLADGETLLSDGRTEMRARCANRISDVPQLPVEHDGPTEEELDSAVNIAMDADEFAGSDGAQFAFNRMTIDAGTGLASSETASSGHSGRNASMASIAGKRITPVSVQPGDSPSGSTGGTPVVVVPPETETENTDNPSGPSTPGSTPSTPLPDVRPTAPGNPTKPGSDGTPLFPHVPPDDVPPPIAEPDTGGPGTPEPPPLTPEPPWSPPGQPPIDTGKPVEDVHEVPEPNSLWLCGAGFAVMLLRRNRARPKR